MRRVWAGLDSTSALDMILIIQNLSPRRIGPCLPARTIILHYPYPKETKKDKPGLTDALNTMIPQTDIPAHYSLLSTHRRTNKPRDPFSRKQRSRITSQRHRHTLNPQTDQQTNLHTHTHTQTITKLLHFSNTPTFSDNEAAFIGRDWELDFASRAVHLSSVSPHPTVAAATTASTAAATLRSAPAVTRFGLGDQVLNDARRHLNGIGSSADRTQALRGRSYLRKGEEG